MNVNVNEKTDKRISTIKNIMVILLIIAVLAVSKISGKVSIQILLSVFIFLLALPLVSAMESAKFPSWLATVIAVLVIIALVLFFVWFVFFTVDMLIQKVPDYAARINDLDGLLKSIAGKWIEIPEGASFFSTLKIDWVGSVIMPTLRSVSSSAISLMSTLLLVVLMTVFLLGERHTIIPKLLNFVKNEEEDRLKGIWDIIVKKVSKYITIKVLISLLTGALFYVVCLIVHLDFAILWGVLAVVLNFIPTIGSIVITVLVTVMAIVQFAPSIGPILFVGISAVVIQNVIGNFLDPRLSGNKLDLSPFIILASLSIFGFIWGIVGMFLAVPLLSIVQLICANIEETKPIAMLLSGRSYRKQARNRYDRRRNPKRTMKNLSKPGYDDYSDEIMFPDRK